MFTIKSCFTVLEPPACDPALLMGLLPDVRLCGEILCFSHTGRAIGKRDISPASISVDFSCLHILKKGPLQTRSSQGCHLLANMLSVIFCAQGSPSRAGPHGNLAHANRTNPSRTCLSVSLSPSLSCLLIPPLSLCLSFPFSSASACLVSLLLHLFHSLSTCFSSCLSLSQKMVQGLCVS